MPNDHELDSALNSITDRGAVLPSWPPSADTAGGSSPVTWALVDGLGVYSASAGSPFLTAPAPHHAALSASEPALTDGIGEELSELREPLRRQMQAVALRSRLSETEISGLVSAVLDVVARHLRIGRDRANHD